MKKIISLVLLIFFILSANHSFATDQLHALAMHGEPLYQSDYEHFDYVNPNAQKGGSLRLAVNGSFDNLNRLVIMGRSAEGLNNIYDKLMTRAWNEPFTLYGLIAQSVEVADDRSWIIFHLNKNAKFHDGTPMTTADVEFSFQAFKKYGHPVRRRVYSLVKEVDLISEHSIKFTFGEGYDRESVLILALMEVMPKHYWQSEGRDISKTTLEVPLGSGPYRVKDVDIGRRITYERVKDYWAKDLPVNVGHNNFDTLVYNYYRDDSVSLQSFKAQYYDVRREHDIQKWKTDYDFRALNEGRVVKEEIAHSRPEWIRAMIFNTRRDLFTDIKVRKALNLLFDFEWINKNFFYNSFTRIDSVFANSYLAAQQGKPQGRELEILEQYREYLPDAVFTDKWSANVSDNRARMREAVALFKEAGWTYNNQKLVNSNGEQFSFEILVNNPNDEKIVLAYARSLERVGIKVRVRSVDSSQFVGRLDDFDYDMVMFRWINSLSPGNEQVNYWGSVARETRGSRNYAGVNNKAIDEIAALIGNSLKREDLVNASRALDRALMHSYYFIPLYYLGHDLLARNMNIGRPEYTPIYGIVQETWWYEEK